MVKLSISLLSPESVKLRLRGYKLLLLGQVIVMVNFLFLFEYFYRYPFRYWETVFVSITGVLLLLLNVFAYYLLQELTGNKALIYTIVVFLYLSVLLSLIVGIQILEKESLIQYYLSIAAMTFSLVSYAVIFYFMIYDIFNEKHEITYRLWGSACIFLLMGSLFGMVYNLMEITMPLEFAFDTDNDLARYVTCYNLSFYTLSGIDSPFETFSLMVKNVTVMESIFSNLYIVLVVGRLLSK